MHCDYTAGRPRCVHKLHDIHFNMRQKLPGRQRQLSGACEQHLSLSQWPSCTYAHCCSGWHDLMYRI